MSTKNPRSIQPGGGGFFQGLGDRIKLIARLMGDNRVNPLLKVLPIASVVYLVFPDIAPGPIDDAALLWLGSYLFVELCPPDVVQEHMQALRKTIPAGWQETDPSEDTVDAEFQETRSDPNRP